MALAANARGRASRVPELITSRENRWLKQFRAALAGEKPRDAANPSAEIVGVEGPHLVETALRAADPDRRRAGQRSRSPTPPRPSANGFPNPPACWLPATDFSRKPPERRHHKESPLWCSLVRLALTIWCAACLFS